jgi:hypothetical protein
VLIAVGPFAEKEGSSPPERSYFVHSCGQLPSFEEWKDKYFQINTKKIRLQNSVSAVVPEEFLKANDRLTAANLLQKIKVIYYYS